MITPWSIHEAEIALYPAWSDGMPYVGPGTRAEVSPLLQCKSSLSIAHTPRDLESGGFNWTGAESTADGVWEISIGFPDGAFTDAISRLKSRPAPGGFHVLVVRFIDEVSGHWSCLRFFYVTLAGDDASEKNQIMERSLRLRSTWLQENVGSATAPSMLPEVLGEVDWVCGGQRITALTYNSATQVWTSLAQNAIGGGGSYARIHGVGDNVTLSAYMPYLDAAAPPANAPAREEVAWLEKDILHIGNADSLVHHGLKMGDGFALQTLGISEPLMRNHTGWNRGLDPVYLIFRYLRRVYATIGDGVLAAADVTYDAAPDSIDPPFQIRPAADGMGMVILPDGAWVDGSLFIDP